MLVIPFVLILLKLIFGVLGDRIFKGKFHSFSHLFIPQTSLAVILKVPVSGRAAPAYIGIVRNADFWAFPRTCSVSISGGGTQPSVF